MHAALCIPAVTGAWQYEGGGAFFNNYALWRFDKSLIEGHDAIDPRIRVLDQSKIGRILTGDAEALSGGGPVKAMLIQNTNPMTVAPEQALVRQGFAREDLFMVVHEQFMTETAQMADIVLPATMFMEHDDLYYGGGHQHISVGAKLIEPPGECRSNHEVLQGLSRRLNAVHPGLRNVGARVDRRHAQEAAVTAISKRSRPICGATCSRTSAPRIIWTALPMRDGKFHFKADWAHAPIGSAGLMGAWEQMPALPDHWAIIEEADEAHPFRLATSPSRSFLNTTFNETPSSQAREGAPTREDASGRRGCAGDIGWRCRHARQCQGRDDADRKAVRWRAPRRADRGIGSSQQAPYRRSRHQHADRRRGGGADRRRRVP